MSHEMEQGCPRRTARPAATLPGKTLPGNLPPVVSRRPVVVDAAVACVWRSVGGLLLVLAVASTAVGQQWAEKMFDHTSHDFGSVARGAKIEHTFTIENKYEEDMHIAEVRSSCGCTTPTIDKQTLKTWEKAKIVASLDTRSFSGRKEAMLTVVFDGPFAAEVQLFVHAYIRPDVVIQPGSVQFGSIAEGTEAVQKVIVTYAGRADWQILKVESPCPYLEARATKTTAPAVGEVSYEVQVRLKPDAPAGYLREYLTLVTNDSPLPNDLREQPSRVPLAVEGVVVSAVTVRPSPLLLGVVATGQSVTRQLVVQGKEPFRITGIESSDPRLSCAVPDSEKALHLLPVTFAAGEAAGDVNATLRIQTSLGKAIEVPVNVRVGSAAP